VGVKELLAEGGTATFEFPHLATLIGHLEYDTIYHEHFSYFSLFSIREIFGSQGATSGANPAQLAHGISVALYNTALGLVVAIPALMFYRYFRGRIEEFTIEMEQAAERLVPHLMRFAVRTAPTAAAHP